MMPEFVARVPATSANLGPGFDCMGLALDLYNQFRVLPGSHFEINVSGVAAKDISRGEDNLFVQAAKVLLQEVQSKISPQQWKICIETAIPSASGLGSSASAIAGGMLLANEIVGFCEPAKKLTSRQVVQLATDMEGHPDNVAPALLGGAWLCLYHQRSLQTFRLSLPQNLKFVVATPDVQVSTDESRQVLPAQVLREDAVFNVAQAARMVLALERNDFGLLQRDFGDKLHEPFRLDAIPYHEAVISAAKKAGATLATLSGSGPTLLLWCACESLAKKTKKAVESVWTGLGIHCSVSVRSPLGTAPAVETNRAREATL